MEGETAMWCEDLKRVIRLRIDEQDVPPEMLRKMLLDVLDGFPCSTDDHGVDWNAKVWRDAFTGRGEDPALIDALADRVTESDAGRCQITRSHVFASSDSKSLLLAVMAWGYGPTGYGPHRALQVLARNSDDGITRAVEQLRLCVPPSAAWQAFSAGGSAKLTGLGAAFGSKVAYFAGYDREKGTGPLIADGRSAWGFWAVDGSWARGSWDIRKVADLYARYVDIATMWAHDLGRRSDDIERALFVMGPYARVAWKQERAADVLSQDSLPDTTPPVAA